MSTTLQVPPRDRPVRWTTRLVREETLEAWAGQRIRGPAEIAALASSIIAESPNERFLVFILNAQHTVIGFHEVTSGIVDASLVHPREVFRPAILANASAIIVAHNHPSGDPTPSAEDRAVTRQLHGAGNILGIRLLDHIVVTDSGAWERVPATTN
jgi:DNA repair protein RadC